MGVLCVACVCNVRLCAQLVACVCVCVCAHHAVSGAATSKATMAFLARLFPNVHESYGTMESGGITRCVRMRVWLPCVCLVCLCVRVCFCV